MAGGYQQGGKLKLFENLKRRFTNKSDGRISLSEINDMFFNSSAKVLGSDMSEITYFTCMKMLSESLGKLPLDLMDDDKRRITDHESSYFFGTSPNPYNTPIELFTYLEYCRNHYGNAYAYLDYDSYGNLSGVYQLDPRRVRIYVNDTEIFTKRPYYYQYYDTAQGKSYWLHPEQVIHVKSWALGDAGLSGKSAREILVTSMTGAKASQQFLNDLYDKGLTANAVVKYVGELNKEKQGDLLRRIEAQAREDGRRLITLPIGFDIQTLDLKLTDSQFYELKKYSSLQIAAAFGIKPDTLNDYSKSSYANSSMQNLSFYIGTLLYNLTLYEQELNRKVLSRKDRANGLSFKFNVSVILRGNPTEQAEVLNKLVSCGVYSINEARRLLDKPSVEGGDVHGINGSMVDINDIGIAYAERGGE